MEVLMQRSLPKRMKNFKKYQNPNNEVIVWREPAEPSNHHNFMPGQSLQGKNARYKVWMAGCEPFAVFSKKQAKRYFKQ